MIDTKEKLAAYLPQLRRASWVAVDTEADSLHAYPEKVCLIQISTDGGDSLVDPLAGIDIGPLLEVLADCELIMHGADYDLRLLRKHHRFLPRALFDTMLAARLLGERQFGLSSLLEKFLGVKLDKGMQKADWARRPLTERMERYAHNDTRYLKPLADRLRAGLEQTGRLAWHQESCARLVADCVKHARPNSDSAWRVRGSSQLSRRQLAVLREIWHWRESEAIAANRPPYFVLSHEALVGIAAKAVTSTDYDHLLPRRFSERRRAGLLKAIERALALPPHAYPEELRPVPQRPSESERRRFRELAHRRDVQAAKLRIDPTLIASRSMLAQLARDWDTHAKELMRWQRELLE